MTYPIQRAQSLPSLNKLTEACTPKTNIERLGEEFKVVNPYLGMNCEGTCQGTAYEIAKSLTEGTEPKRAELTLSDDIPKKERKFIELDDLEQSKKSMLDHLEKQPNGSVFVVETPEHYYNLIKDDKGSVFLFDGTIYLYKEIKTTDDFVNKVSQWDGNEMQTETGIMDYIACGKTEENPCEGEKTAVTYFGPLHPKWSALLNEKPSADNHKLSRSTSAYQF